MSHRIAPESLLSHADFVRRLAWRLLRDEHQVEDVVQQTWLAAMQRPPTRAGELRAWLGVVARNIALKSRRTDSRRQRHEMAGARTVRVPTPSEVLEREATRQRVVQAVLGLDEPYRAVVLLRFFESLPPRDIAASLGVPVETVRTRLKRAFATLRQRLDAEHGGDRRAWVMLLMPLARGAPLIGLEGVPAPPSSPGAPAMTAAVSGLAIGKIAAATLLVAAAVGGVWWMARAGDGGGAAPPREPETADVTAPADAEAPRVRTRAPSLTATADSEAPTVEERALGPTTIRGRLIDEFGKPFANAIVVVRPEIEDHNESKAFEREREPEERPFAETDEDGNFVLRLRAAEKVMVSANWTPAIQPIEDPAGWITPPIEGVIVRARRMPAGTLVVRLNDAATGSPMERFIVRVVVDGGEDFNLVADAEEAERMLRLDRDGDDVRDERRLTVTLVEPAVDVAPSQEVALQPGERTVVTFDMPDRPAISGQVLGASGVPVGDAFVYVGDEFRGRRNWARPVNPEHIPDGARTDADGHYTVRGDGGLVTAFHPGHGAVTVAVADAGRLSFPARGVIRGRVLDLGGKPLAGARIELDRSDIVTELDEHGRFTFESVAAGARWVSLPKPIRHIIGVQVAPGEAVDAEIGGWIENVEGEMLVGGALAKEFSCGGVVVGMGRGPHSLHECDVMDGRFRIGRILPGRYVFLSGGAGKVAIMDIDGPNVKVDAGTATLTVKAAPGTEVFVVPGDPSDHVRLFAPYNAQRVPESGEATWGPLPAGRYAVGIARRGIKTHVEVGDGPASIDLD